MRPLIHIGLHKTGSSFLQKVFFPDSALGFQTWPADPLTIHRMFVNHGPFTPVDPTLIQEFHRKVEAAHEAGRTVVVSNERLSGHPASGGFDAAILAERIADALGPIRALVVYREQVSGIRSAYGQYVTEGGSLSIERFMTPPQQRVRRVPGFDLSYWDYSQLVAHYQAKIGCENVLAIPYEMLAKAPVEFLNRIGRFARGSSWVDIDGSFTERHGVVNRHRSPAAQVVARSLNRTLYRNQLGTSGLTADPRMGRAIRESSQRLSPWAPSGFDRRIKASQIQQITDRVEGRFESDNARLANLTGFDLEPFGYALPSRREPRVSTASVRLDSMRRTLGER